ncbi:transposase [uncultured Desulfobacter sp.]|uniref:transposase n=1 Tax=uncultured Desulfobacter sp. TaxID=240139 RepID=UPI002AA945E2|nr:transposase [uncultured Desulfobacter sp.]
MPRTPRLMLKGEESVYHVMSRTALPGYPFGDVEKDYMVQLIQQLSRLYFVEIFGYCIMGNHFHLLVRVFSSDRYSDDEIKQRYLAFFGEDQDFQVMRIDTYRKKWSNLSEFIKEIKQTFSRFYNKLHNRRGTLWGDRFKSVIVEKGETLINCLAYIDLNPVRAGIVKRPEQYRFSSLGYHLQTDNSYDFLSLDFGLKEFGQMSDQERLETYRGYIYEAGAVNTSEKEQDVIEERIIETERKKEYKITRIDRFKNRTRYFTDSGIIGSKAFVSKTYAYFKRPGKTNQKNPRQVAGLNGIYSLKRLTEM